MDVAFKTLSWISLRSDMYVSSFELRLQATAGVVLDYREMHGF
jgi:hypothetical protein